MLLFIIIIVVVVELLRKFVPYKGLVITAKRFAESEFAVTVPHDDAALLCELLCY